MSEIDRALEHANAQLAEAQWGAARDEYNAILEAADIPEAQDGLGLSYWWLNQIPESHLHRSRAYVGYKQRGNLKRAAMLATWLGREQVFLSANVNAMKGWFARAERHLAETDPCIEASWFRLLRASMLASPEELEEVAFTCAKDAHQVSDADLEALALAFGGIALVSQAHVASGMAYLDEAMAFALSGEVTYLWVSEIFCLMLSACDVAGDLGRTENWCRTAELFAAQHHFPFLAATCRTTYGSFLTTAGRWQDAEAELLQAIALFESGHLAFRTRAVIKLADLRVLQGQLEQAEALLAGYQDQGDALVPLARLYMARGEPVLARAVLDQGLPAESPFTLDAAPKLRLLVDVHLALGDLDLAKHRTTQLVALANQADSVLLLSQADLAQGQILRAEHSPEAAAYFQAALTRLQAYDQSVLAGRVRLEMARLLQDFDRPGAITWARAAHASFERIGAVQDAAEASALLYKWHARGFGAEKHADALTPREAEVLALLSHGLTNREIAKKLVVSTKTVEHHVSQILAKLGAHTRAEAAALAASHKF